MTEKNLKSRIVHKHDLESNWAKATGFIPKQAEIIVYDIDSTHNYERFKIGDGVTNVNALPFADDAVRVTVDDALSTISANPVQNKVVSTAISNLNTLIGDTAVSEQISNVIANTKYAGSATVGGAATSANKLTTARTISLTGDATGSVSFDGSDNASITTSVTSERGVITSGDGSAYAATVPGITSLTAGVSFIMIPHVVSASTAPTLNVNGLGAKTIRRRLSSLSTSVQAGYTSAWLSANTPFRVTYDGTQWVVEGLTKPAAADLYGTLAVAKGGTGATSIIKLRHSIGLFFGTGEIFNTGDEVGAILDLETVFQRMHSQNAAAGILITNSSDIPNPPDKYGTIIIEKFGAYRGVAKCYSQTGNRFWLNTRNNSGVWSGWFKYVPELDASV